MTKMRLVLLVLLGLLIALFAGWFWGSSGRRAAESSLAVSQLEGDLARARASLLQARVDLFEVNFGNAGRALEAAKQPLAGVVARLQQDGRAEAARRASDALAAVEQAQQLAGKLDQTANARAADAIRALDDVARSLGKQE